MTQLIPIWWLCTASYHTHHLIRLEMGVLAVQSELVQVKLNIESSVT